MEPIDESKGSIGFEQNNAEDNHTSWANCNVRTGLSDVYPKYEGIRDLENESKDAAEPHNSHDVFNKQVVSDQNLNDCDSAVSKEQERPPTKGVDCP